MSTKTKSEPAWAKKLKHVEQLRDDSRGTIFDRVTVLVEVFDDDDFRRDKGLADDFAAADVLSAYVSDLCADFLQLRDILKHFPQRQQWQEMDLWKMLNETITAHETAMANRKTRREHEQPKTRRRVTAREFDTLAKSKKEIETRQKFTVSELSGSQKRVTELEEEIRGLRQHVAEQDVQISELESQLSSEAVAA